MVGGGSASHRRNGGSKSIPGSGGRDETTDHRQQQQRQRATPWRRLAVLVVAMFTICAIAALYFAGGVVLVRDGEQTSQQKKAPARFESISTDDKDNTATATAAAAEAEYNYTSYHMEMIDLIDRLLQPSPLFAEYNHPGYSQGLTMLNRKMLWGLKRQVEHIVDAQVEGDIYELGSWRGGASIFMALVSTSYERLKAGQRKQQQQQQPQRHFWVFDSFEGFSADRQFGNDTLLLGVLDGTYWKAPMDKVRDAFISYTTPEFVESRVHFVKGFFEDVVPEFCPPRPAALLRLDGDLYNSTLIALRHLYPSVQRGGEVIVDDYEWNPLKWGKKLGIEESEADTSKRKICSHAVDEYREENNITTPITKEYVRPSWTKDGDVMLVCTER